MDIDWSAVNHIILFFSKGCGYCELYKEENWPNLAKAARKCDIEVSEVNVDSPGTKADLMKFYKSDVVPYTVFMRGTKILGSNAGSFETGKLIKTLKSVNKGPKMRYSVEY